MDKHIYDIWLQKVLAVRTTHIKALMTLFENSEAVYQADEQSLRICGLLGRQELQRALNKDLTEAHRIFKLSVHNGIKVVSYTDEYYPPSLRKIADPPLVLYVKGTLPSQTSLQVAIVGTREPSRIGRQAAFTFANTLTKQKALVVSGGAVGVDTQAHYGALQAGGTTLCVCSDFGISARQRRTAFFFCQSQPPDRRSDGLYIGGGSWSQQWGDDHSRLCC